MCQLFPIISDGIDPLVISTARNRLLMFNAWQQQIGYWRVLQDGTKSIKERKKISLELIKQLEETPIIE